MEKTEVLKSFRDMMRHVEATVFVVTTGAGDERRGIIATAVNSVSFEPPSIMVCINRTTSLHGDIAHCESFAVNALPPSGEAVARHFAGGAEGPDRFAVGDWTEVEGAPVLADANSSIVCRKAAEFGFGTHTIFIGEVLWASHRSNSRPLRYFDGAFLGDA